MKNRILFLEIFLGIIFAAIAFSSAAPNVDINKPCKPNDTWKEDCNQCFCGLQNLVYCTKKLCVGNPDEIETKTDCSKEGVTWNDGCNTCTCIGGQEACTLQLCPEQTQQTQQTQETQQKTKRSTDFTKSCKEGENWQDDCNSCTCVGGLPACTEMLCIPNQKPDLGDIDASKACNGKESWTAPDGCNKCTCFEGKTACTKMGCEHTQVAVEKTRRSSNIEACKDGQTWKEDCNTCTCMGGIPACTLKGCLPTQTKQEIDFTKACKEGDSWLAEDKCNNCYCAGGLPACTKKLCITEKSKRSTDGKKCEVGAKWTEDCNDCICGKDGQPECSRRLCADQGPKVDDKLFKKTN